MSLHEYINVSKLFDFSSKKTVDSIYHDLENVYKITNVMQYDDEDALYVICEALYRDYVNELANYESYVEFGMDARIMMELRKSAVFPVGEKYLDFFREHNSCETVDDIKGMRIDFITKIGVPDYLDNNWQYYMLIKYMWGWKAKDFDFDYETCFADGDPQKQSTLESYRWDFIHSKLDGYKDPYMGGH